MIRTRLRRQKPIPKNPERIRQEGSSVLDVARCPKCDAPLIPRHSRLGPYFQCRCRRK